MTMAVPNPTPQTLDVEDDYDQLLVAEQRLKELHIQLREMRATIPNMVRPLITHHDSPVQLYQTFADAATTATREVTAFTQIMHDDQTKAVLDRAATSRKEKPGPIKPWRAAEHPDWLDLTVRDKDRSEIEMDDKSGQKDMVEEGLSGEVEQDVGTLIQTFNERHPDVKVHNSDETKIIKIEVPARIQMSFSIVPNANPRGPPTYNVSTSGTMKLHHAILRSIAARPRPHDLTELLEMLAAYHDIGTRKCDKCNLLLDSIPQFPAVRRRPRAPKPSDGGEQTWQALHERCS
ncbi:MAG: hypothetical protein M1817_002896 [Caeruleum heppii]|nr:MAG: hypothetical protein M1817_002896 [Caeruleum heppii]